MSSVKDALAIASRGLAVFPARNKKPLVPWQTAATDDPGVIDVWWRQFPNAEIGVPMPAGTVAVDIDDWGAAKDSGLEFPDSSWQATRTDGHFQVLYKSDGRDVPQTVGRGGIKLDTRSGGKGYVIAYNADAFRPDAWKPAPAWVYERAPREPGEARDPQAPLITHADIISWLGTLVNATGGQVTEEGYMTILRSAHENGRIVDGDPLDPWTDHNFREFARDAAKFEVMERPKALDSPWKPDPKAAPVGDGAPAGFLSIVEYRKTVPHEVPWLVHGLIYKGGVTLLSGPAKAGKSTLMSQVQWHREHGGEFLGHDVPVGPTLLVTEEGGIAVTAKTDGVDNLIVYDRKAAAGETFEDTLNKVTLWLEMNPDGLVFIDTLAVWASIDDENDASKTTKAIGKVMLLAQVCDAPVVIVHHTRKGGGANGEGIRGSGAILATVDISAELIRPNPTTDDRWLDLQGRVIYPTRTTLEFDRGNGRYAQKDLSSEYRDMEDELSVVRTGDAPMTKAEVVAAGMTVEKLSHWVMRGRIHEDKRGQGRPTLYWRIPPASQPSSSPWRPGDEEDE